MTTYKQGFIVNKLLEKGGVVNKVATAYVKAGFNIRLKPDLPSVDLIAIRGSEKYCIKVLHEKKTYDENALKDFLSSCREAGYTPVVVLYGSGPKIAQDFLDKNKNVKIRRFRFRG